MPNLPSTPPIRRTVSRRASSDTARRSRIGWRRPSPAAIPSSRRSSPSDSTVTMPMPARDRGRQLVLALARAGHGHRRGVEAGPQDRLQLASGRDVSADAAAAQVGHDRQRGVCLDRERDPEPVRQDRSERLHAPTDQVQVVDVEGRAELRGQGRGRRGRQAGPQSRTPPIAPVDRTVDSVTAAPPRGRPGRRCARRGTSPRQPRRGPGRAPRANAPATLLHARRHDRAGGHDAAARSSVPMITRSRARSYSRLVPVRMTPAAMTAPVLTSTPSRSAAWAPTKTSSSTITGRRPGGSRTPPIWTPAERWTRAPIWAHEPTRTCESTMVPSPTQAPTLTYEGGMIVTPGAR